MENTGRVASFVLAAVLLAAIAMANGYNVTPMQISLSWFADDVAATNRARNPKRRPSRPLRGRSTSRPSGPRSPMSPGRRSRRGSLSPRRTNRSRPTRNASSQSG
jgi:hypothetical protein